jgi:NSS family neurotransmitter:Na+ symporter|nr:sodium-dependent transporter [Anaerotruncus rubiinfantis]
MDLSSHKKRNQWASRLGFILATAGAAVGLGNLWKFPYLMGKNGGFQFLAAYLVFVVLLGLPVMITEMSIGRYTQRNPVDAYRTINRKTTFIGVMGVLSAFIILSYYSVIGGWILKYIASYATTFAAPVDFAAYIAEPVQPVVWHLVFMLATCIICYKGTHGIEKASTIMMPALFIILVIIIVRSVTLPGAGDGLRFIFSATGSKFSFASLAAALGQVFYSLSLCMGITITYGSYLGRHADIPKSCLTVAGLDTAVAVLAGLAIFPAVFSFGLEPAQGPSLIFGTLPKVFQELYGGLFFALLFFILLFFAALTSAIALLECVISFTMDDLHWSRKKSVLVLGLLVFLAGVPSALSYGVLADFTILNYSFFDFMGMLTDNILMPLGGIAMCVYIGWFWGPGKLIAHIESDGVSFKLKKAWLWCVRIITPVMITIVTIIGFISIYNTVRG